MAAKTLITEAEYLRMTFDGREPDYVGGELVERGMPNYQHGRTQSVFSELMRPWRLERRLFNATELRIQTAPGHYRVADAVVYRDREPVELIPTETPFIVLEIVSPDDTYAELMTKLAEYETMGVAHVWIADPGLRTLRVFKNGNLLHVDAFDVPEFGLRFTASALFD